MNRGHGIFVLMSMISAGSQALAASPPMHPPSAKRLLIACMTREMSSSRTLSYNDATKMCKTQVNKMPMKTQSATLASGTVKPMS